jgi:uracil-DNA glycosylase
LPVELDACRPFLKAELALLTRKRVVIALGQIAFRTFLRVWREICGPFASGKMRFEHGGEWTLPGGVLLIASYHPSQQNTSTGRLTRAMFQEIFRRAREIVGKGVED